MAPRIRTGRAGHWFAALAALSFASSGCDSHGHDHSHEHEHEHSHDHANLHHHTAPDEYETRVNPLAGDEAAVQAGSALYAANCAHCHGQSGAGDGPAAVTPSPPTSPTRSTWR